MESKSIVIKPKKTGLSNKIMDVLKPFKEVVVFQFEKVKTSCILTNEKSFLLLCLLVVFPTFLLPDPLYFQHYDKNVASYRVHPQIHAFEFNQVSDDSSCSFHSSTIHGTKTELQDALMNVILRKQSLQKAILKCEFWRSN